MKRKKRKENEKNFLREVVLVLIFSFVIFMTLAVVYAADPQGPDTVNSINNSTKGTVDGYMFNISGGYVSTLNLTATIQNTRWKAFVGNVTGSFTLDDATGATIYDWTLSSITGRIYATRNSSTPAWSSVECTTNTTLRSQRLAQEDSDMSHTGLDDNVSATFDNFTHAQFWVGSVSITANTCPTVRTYVNDAPQAGVGMFEEMAIYETTGNYTLYATILEEDATGYDGGNNTYDFQMIIPENGSAGWTSATPYYLYVEIGT